MLRTLSRLDVVTIVFAFLIVIAVPIMANLAAVACEMKQDARGEFSFQYSFFVGCYQPGRIGK